MPLFRLMRFSGTAKTCWTMVLELGEFIGAEEQSSCLTLNDKKENKTQINFWVMSLFDVAILKRLTFIRGYSVLQTHF